MEAIEGLYMRRDDIRFAFIKYLSDFIRKKIDLRNANPELGGTYTSSSEKAMAPHSSTLAWKIPWTEGPGGLQSMGSLGVGHD